MPGKNSKQAVQKTETPVAPTPAQKGGKKVAAQVETTPAPVAAAPVEATPAPQKGGKKTTAAPAQKAAPVEATPAPAPQKGGKKVAAQKAAPAPVAAAPVEATPAPAQKATKGAKKAAAPAQKAGAKAEKKAPAQKAAKAEKKAAPAKEAADEEGDEESGDRRIRSFKVKLPGKEEFEGRFTGLTPYQAANKALSKYFRETEKPKAEITFSICESTRKSKKSVYSYVGKRQKLDTPVTYKIQDGREIVKNFKNSLKKVKKSETATESA